LLQQSPCWDRSNSKSAERDNTELRHSRCQSQQNGSSGKFKTLSNVWGGNDARWN
jgi:hypothetical protein